MRQYQAISMREEQRKVAQFRDIQIGNGTELKAILAARNDVIAFDGLCGDTRAAVILRRPNIQINDVKRAMVNEDGYLAVLQIIQTASHEGIAVPSEVLHWRRKVELSIEPRLDGVLIGGNYIHQVIGHQRSNMARDNFLAGGRSSGACHHNTDEQQGSGEGGATRRPDPWLKPWHCFTFSFWRKKLANVVLELRRCAMI